MGNLNGPLVSVVVPCYNHGVFLKDSLNSLLSQTYRNWECIVVDNCSTDNTKDVVNEFSKKDKRIKYLYSEIKGVSAARNKGIQNSAGAYILPLDADDKIADSYISKAVNILENKENIKIVYSEAGLFGDASGKWNLPPFSMPQMLKENVVFCSGVYRRIDYNKTNGYNESFLQGFEDWDFWLSLLKNGGDVFKINEVLFFYRIRKTSRNNSLDLENQKKLRRQIFEEHKDLYEKHLNFSDVIFENYVLENKYRSTVQSPDFKIGKMLVGPIRTLKQLFNK